MRFENYVTEAAKVSIESFEKIRKDYSEILNVYKKTMPFFLLRGSGRKYNFASRAPRKNRTPLDMPEVIHKILDDLFYKRFGWRVRSEGVYVTVDPSLAETYGVYAYIIFPKNGFKYVYSEKIGDLYSYIENMFGMTTISSFKHGVLDSNDITDEQRRLLGHIPDVYTSKEIESFIKDGDDSEIAIKCDKYYSLLLTRENERALNTFLENL